jgi:RimJ/RimL family protein N-acetyltransferase
MKIQTKRLILREWRARDASQLVRQINNLEITKWLSVVPYPYTIKDAKWFIGKKLEEKKLEQGERKEYNFALQLQGQPGVIGGIGIHKIDYSIGVGTIGYWLGQDHWRNGYMSEALEGILDFAFNKLGLARLEAGVFKGNPSSGVLLEKYGFTLEGTKRKAIKSKATGIIHDELWYGLLKEDIGGKNG